MAQAKLYRLAALLIIHRLRHPLKVEDDSAKGHAMSTFTERVPFAQPTLYSSTALPLAILGLTWSKNSLLWLWYLAYIENLGR